LVVNPKGSIFQIKVWKELLKVPYGKTSNYLAQSRALGDVKAVRAVASANGKNPLLIIIPCHRIIGSDGSLTGYAGGIWRKKWLLAHENPLKQQSLF
jgi:methylated-DNA-[protein]-cysteine S-methyltransferase